ncbi:hypothetical protein MRX96_010132 [Rhipicephalus microplus]
MATRKEKKESRRLRALSTSYSQPTTTCGTDGRSLSPCDTAADPVRRRSGDSDPLRLWPRAAVLDRVQTRRANRGRAKKASRCRRQPSAPGTELGQPVREGRKGGEREKKS